MTAKLTVNLGLRYELLSPISERFGRQSNFDFANLTLFIPKGKDQDSLLPPNFATAFPNVKMVRGQVDKYLIPWDKTDFFAAYRSHLCREAPHGRSRRLLSILWRGGESAGLSEPRRIGAV